jgi:hypothetical protein
VQKLERGKAGDGNAQPFYILWVPAGADRVAALDELRASGKITADVPAYCAEWKFPNDRWRSRMLGPSPRSRLTNQRRISEDEVEVLFEAICHDLESSGFSSSSSASDDVRDQQLMCEMTDRQLIGVILKSHIGLRVGPIQVSNDMR